LVIEISVHLVVRIINNGDNFKSSSINTIIVGTCFSYFWSLIDLDGLDMWWR